VAIYNERAQKRRVWFEADKKEADKNLAAE
jgi:hypothetical protein